MKPTALLVVDDDPSCLEFLELLLRSAGYAVRTAKNGVEALLSIDEETPAAVLSDLRMPEMDGLELLVRVKQRWPDLPLIIVTVEEELSCVVESIQKGAVNYLLKPCPAERILDAVRKALSARSSAAPSTAGELPEIVGRSRPMVELKHAIALAARVDVNVLITGETGTGKELAARAIHRLSNLAGGPFVAHNCALAPHDLVESQFFGYERGAFTGADHDRAGLLETADGGCLFLDELETMPAEQQAKLLRVIDDGEVRRLGSPRTQRVSVRFLAATNGDPLEAIGTGRLREDFYYRLRGYEIHLPPLRDRREDIPLLVHHFLRGKSCELTPAALAALAAHRWSGNVRELKNLVQGAAAIAPRGSIDAEQLARWFERAAPRVGARATTIPARLCSLRDAEHDFIRQAMATFGGNMRRASESLGIDRSTLRRKLAEMREVDRRTGDPSE